MMESEKSRIVKVFATAEFEVFNSESVEDAERRAFEDADMELRSIYAGNWTVELAEFQRERVY